MLLSLPPNELNHSKAAKLSDQFNSSSEKSVMLDMYWGMITPNGIEVCDLILLSSCLHELNQQQI